MAVEVEQATPVTIGRVTSGRVQAGHHPDRDRAVASEHQQAAVAGQQLRNAPGQFLDRGHDLAGVLGEPVLPIGSPDLFGEIPGVADIDTGRGQRLDQPGRTQGARRPVLARGVAPGAARHADHGKSDHEP